MICNVQYYLVLLTSLLSLALGTTSPLGQKGGKLEAFNFEECLAAAAKLRKAMSNDAASDMMFRDLVTSCEDTQDSLKSPVDREAFGVRHSEK
jgi:hypothetical protein